MISKNDKLCILCCLCGFGGLLVIRAIYNNFTYIMPYYNNINKVSIDQYNKGKYVTISRTIHIPIMSFFTGDIKNVFCGTECKYVILDDDDRVIDGLTYRNSFI